MGLLLLVCLVAGRFQPALCQHGIARVPEGSKLKEPLNRALLTVTEKDQWKDLVQTYLGPVH